MNGNESTINNSSAGHKNLVYNDRLVDKSNRGAKLFCEKLADGDLYLDHCKDNGGYKTQFYLETADGEIKRTQIVPSKNSLAEVNNQRDNKLKKIVADKFKVHIDGHLSDAGEFFNENFADIFPVEDILIERTKKEKQLVDIANKLDSKYKILFDRTTEDMYIFNLVKKIYTKFTEKQFAVFLHWEYGQRFLADEVKKIMGAFSRLENESKEYIAFKNCLLNVTNLETEDFTDKEFVKFQVPYDWNPEAYSEFFETKLREILGTDEKILLFKQIVGYCFINGNRENKMFFLTGEGANGKSVLMTLIRAIFKDSVAGVGLHEFKKEFGLQPLLGKRINILPDLPKELIKDTGAIKAVTGEDLITVNRKHKEPVNTLLTCKIVGVGNHLPPVTDDSFAFWRRVVHLELTNTFTDKKKDAKLKEKLISDDEGMQWLIYESITAYKGVQNNGWAGQKTEDEIRKEYLKQSNPCLYAAEELYEMTNDPNDFITRDEAKMEITGFLQDINIRPPLDAKQYYNAMRRIGGNDHELRIDGNKLRGFAFVKLKTSEESESALEHGNESLNAQIGNIELSKG